MSVLERGLPVNKDIAVLATRMTLLVLVAVAWLLGLVIQITTRVSTGYMDVLPPQLLLAVLVCQCQRRSAYRPGQAQLQARRARRDSDAGLDRRGLRLLTASCEPTWSEAESGGEMVHAPPRAPFWIGSSVISAGLGASAGS
jgi:hypothetical protein